MEQSVKILISGPIRPSEQSVLSVVKTIRDQIPNCSVFLSTWSGQLTDTIRRTVDFFSEMPEPTDAFIQKMIHARTRQQVKLGAELDGWTYNIYKMFYGVHCVCELARPYVEDTDIVIRIRTDSVFRFHPDYLRSLLANAGNAYITKKGDGLDWFALTTFDVLWRTWCFPSIEEYNETVARAWNAEDVVKLRIPVPIYHLDPGKVDMYILRENGRKHYFA